jgi:hypothetical protein
VIVGVVARPGPLVGVLADLDVDGVRERALGLEQVCGAEKRIWGDVTLYAEIHAYVYHAMRW